MKKYEVILKETVLRTVVVIAKDEDQAEDFANDPDQWFRDSTELDDWSTVSIEELEDSKS